MGHIAEVYDMLDKTDPEHPGMSSAEAKEESRLAQIEERRLKEDAALQLNEDGQAVTSAATNQAPLIPAVWTLDSAPSTIPESRVNGSVSGKPFISDSARIVRVGTADVLTFQQGEGAVADAELFIYLRLSRGEQLAGREWTISKDMKGKEVPQVIKRWKKDPRYAPQQRAFTAGYAMKLKFGEMTNGVLPGKIFVGLPDTERTVVAGTFSATLPAKR